MILKKKMTRMMMMMIDAGAEEGCSEGNANRESSGGQSMKAVKKLGEAKRTKNSPAQAWNIRVSLQSKTNQKPHCARLASRVAKGGGKTAA